MNATDHLRALVAEATPVIEQREMDRHEALVASPAYVRLIALAPQLAELCADMGETVRLMLAPMGKQFRAGYEADLRRQLILLDALFPEEEKNERWRAGLWRNRQ